MCHSPGQDLIKRLESFGSTIYTRPMGYSLFGDWRGIACCCDSAHASVGGSQIDLRTVWLGWDLAHCLGALCTVNTYSCRRTVPFQGSSSIFGLFWDMPQGGERKVI